MFVGKMIGGFLGLITGGLFGLFLGVVLGHLLDKLLLAAEEKAIGGGFGGGNLDQQAVVFRVTFALLGRMAKSDGRVTEDEIQHVEVLMSRMRLSPQARQEAVNFFSEGKSPHFDLDQALRAFSQSTKVSAAINLMLVEMLTQMAMADGEMTPDERSLLERIAYGLGVSRWQLQLIIARYRGGAYDHFSQQESSPSSSGETLETAYATLGVAPNTPMAEVKKAYRRLMSKHHPDKLQGEGVTDNMLELAKERAQKIQSAYDLIKKQGKSSKI